MLFLGLLYTVAFFFVMILRRSIWLLSVLLPVVLVVVVPRGQSSAVVHIAEDVRMFLWHRGGDVIGFVYFVKHEVIRYINSIVIFFFTGQTVKLINFINLIV